MINLVVIGSHSEIVDDVFDGDSRIDQLTRSIVFDVDEVHVQMVERGLIVEVGPEKAH